MKNRKKDKKLNVKCKIGTKKCRSVSGLLTKAKGRGQTYTLLLEQKLSLTFFLCEIFTLFVQNFQSKKFQTMNFGNGYK